MSAVYTVTSEGHLLADHGSLALAAEFSRIAARDRPGTMFIVENRDGDTVATYVLMKGKLEAWVR